MNMKKSAEEGIELFLARVEKSGLTVYTQGSSIEYAINTFKRRVEKFGILDEYKNNQYYLKPSAAKRIKKRHGKQ